MMTTRQAADYLGISFRYLGNMRMFMHNHEGPPFIQAKAGAPCYYSKEELDKWRAAHKWRPIRSKGKYRVCA